MLNDFSKIDFPSKPFENPMNPVPYKNFEYLQTNKHVIDNEFLYTDEYKHHLRYR